MLGRSSGEPQDRVRSPTYIWAVRGLGLARRMCRAGIRVLGGPGLGCVQQPRVNALSHGRVDGVRGIGFLPAHFEFQDSRFVLDYFTDRLTSVLPLRGQLAYAVVDFECCAAIGLQIHLRSWWSNLCRVI